MTKNYIIYKQSDLDLNKMHLDFNKTQTHIFDIKTGEQLVTVPVYYDDPINGNTKFLIQCEKNNIESIEIEKIEKGESQQIEKRESQQTPDQRVIINAQMNDKQKNFFKKIDKIMCKQTKNKLFNKY